jgi:hypothetical protein
MAATLFLPISSDSEAEMVRCNEKLNVAERMELIAFPVLCLADESERPMKRTRRAEQPSMFEMIPDACALQILAFATSMQDFLPMMLVCKQWRTLLNNSTAADETVWKSLCRRYYPTLINVHDSLYDEADITLQQLFLDRAKCVKERFRPNVRPDRDRYVLTFDSFDSDDEYPYDDEVDVSFEPLDFASYRQSFTAVLWKTQDDSMQVKAEATLSRNGIIRLQLPADLDLSTVTSLAVYFQHPIEPARCLLYSGTIDQSGDGPTFDSYNRFEKFHAKSFFVGFRPLDYWPHGARIAIPSVKPSLVHGNMPYLSIQVSWQTEYDGTGAPMSRKDVLVFLEKGMAIIDQSSCFLSSPPTTSEVWSMARFSPQPVTSYGFLIDFRLDVGDTLPCVSDYVSHYYEPTELVESNINLRGVCLKFDIPIQCQGMVPSTDTSDTSFLNLSVYAIDKATGRQVLLYEGSEITQTDQHRENRGVCHWMKVKEDFECFDASTFFSGRSSYSEMYGTFIAAVLKIYPDPMQLEIMFRWTYEFSDSDSSAGVHHEQEEFLTFLEKGLTWR